MPGEVRDRLRRNLWRELDAPARFRLNRARAPLAAAAGVAILTAGAVIIAQAVPSPRDTGPAANVLTNIPRPTSTAVDIEHADADLDRCFAAAKTSPQGNLFPERPLWTTSFSAEVGGISVTAARADGRPLFCESTLTSVTLSNPAAVPAYASGSTTGALLATPNGTIAGVVDPTWDSFEIWAGDGADSLISLPDRGDGMFVMYTSIRIATNTHLHAQQLPNDLPPTQTDRPDDDPMYPIREIPTVPPPLVSVVDRPVSPPADRTSLSGKALDQCMQSTGNPKPDRDSWQPGAAVTVRGNELIMAVNAKGVSACQWQPDARAHKAAEPTDQMFQSYMQLVREPQTVDSTQMPVIVDGEDGLVILGTVRSDATRMNVQVDGKVQLDTNVRAGTFVSVVPDSMLDEGQLNEDHLNSLTATIYDAKGNELYSGPLHAH
jgi:hypothetical protein